MVEFIEGGWEGGGGWRVKEASVQADSWWDPTKIRIYLHQKSSYRIIESNLEFPFSPFFSIFIPFYSRFTGFPHSFPFEMDRSDPK